MKRAYVALILAVLVVVAAYFSYLSKNEPGDISDPKVIYSRYLSSYDEEGYQLLAVYLRTELIGWNRNEESPHWDFYLYHPRGELLVVRVSSDGVSKTSPVKTVIDYSPIAMPLSRVKELEPWNKEGRYFGMLYLFLNTTNYTIPEDWGQGVKNPKCRNISEILEGKSLKLLKGLRGGYPAGVVKVEPVGGVLFISGGKDRNPFCKGTWLVVEPGDSGSDLVRVIYYDAEVQGKVESLDKPVFNGTELLKLVSRLKVAQKAAGFSIWDSEGIVVNASGVYVNPNAKKVAERVYPLRAERREYFSVSSATVLRDGSVELWTMEAEKAWLRDD